METGKNRTKTVLKIFAALFAAALLFFLILSLLYINHGECSDEKGNLTTWRVDLFGTLTIEGEGDMADDLGERISFAYVDHGPFSSYIDETKFIRRVKLGDGLTSIGRFTIPGLRRVRSLTIPENVTRINERAFEGMGLRELHIPAKVTGIAPDAFDFCPDLVSITVDEANPAFTAVDGILYNKEKTALLHYPANKTGAVYTVDAQVKAVGDHAFIQCKNLTTVGLPAGLTSIGDSAFAYSEGLTELHIPEGVTKLGDWAFYSCIGINDITIPDSVTALGADLFGWCESLQTVQLPAALTALPDSMFEGCKSLKTAALPASLRVVERHAFHGSGIEEITLPEGVTEIGTNAFYDCEALKSITIPKSVSKLGLYPFGDCDALTDVYFGGTKEQWNTLLDNAKKETGDVTGLERGAISVHFAQN